MKNLLKSLFGSKSSKPPAAQKAKTKEQQDLEVLLEAESKKQQSREKGAEILKSSPRKTDPNSREFGNIPNPFRDTPHDETSEKGAPAIPEAPNSKPITP